MSRIYDALKKAEQDSRKRTDPIDASAAQRQALADGTRSPSPVAQAVAVQVVPQPAVVHSQVAAAVAVAEVASSVAGAPSTVVAPALQTGTAPATISVQIPAKLDGRDTRASDTTKKASKDRKDDVRLQVFSPTRAELIGTEELRRLRTKLQHVRDKQPIKTVLITSALAGEGKTFIAVNLAHTFTMQHHARVLVIDADLRKPQVHADIGVPNDTGLSDYLDGRCGLDGIIRTSPVSKLDYILGGTVCAQPAELVASTRFRDLIGAVADQYDWIIVDTPPVLPVSDAAVIARCCDAVLLVVAACETSGDMAQAAQKELRNANLIGIVLNRATHRSSSYKSYYSSYSYNGAQSGNPAATQ
jgi:capsular exopolysaccharide synthesis family protein